MFDQVNANTCICERIIYNNTQEVRHHINNLTLKNQIYVSWIKN